MNRDPARAWARQTWCRAQGELDRAVTELERVVELDRQVSHPDLASDTEMLHRVRQELAGSDPGGGPR